MNNPMLAINNIILAIPKYLGTINSILIHTILFTGLYSSLFFGVPLETVNLMITTIVSLEAIYLSIFLQLSVNQSQKSLDAVNCSIDEIGHDLDEIGHDLDEIGNLESEISDKTKIPHNPKTQIQELKNQLQSINNQLNLILDTL